MVTIDKNGYLKLWIKSVFKNWNLNKKLEKNHCKIKQQQKKKNTKQFS